MAMAFERPGMKKSLDCDLLQLVGDYLASHSERSYINMEDMVDAIQSRSYRFGRMKRLTFSAMVKRAYQRYLQMQAPVMQSPPNPNPSCNPNEDYMMPVSSGNMKVVLPATPTQADYSSDSDVEIVLDDSSMSPVLPKADNIATPHATPSSTQEQVNKRPRMEQSVIKSAGSSTSTIVKVDREVSGASGSSEVNSNVKNEKPRGVKRKLEEDGPTKPAAKGLEGLQKRTKRQIPVLQVTDVTFQDFAGGEKVIEEICQLLLHLKHPEIYKTIGVTPPRGFLLHGPPGCGKSLLANAIAGELKLPMLKVAATELISGISGESESNIRDLFQQALDLAPCMIFLDEIDSITPKRETAQREMERRIVAQLLACMDELSTKEKGDSVVLIGATNRIETIDSALRRAGRFDREISIGIPDEQAREKILRVICKNLRLTDGFQFSQLAKLTPGYVGADLQSLAREAAVHAINEVLNISGGVQQQVAKEPQPSETVNSEPMQEKKEDESSGKGMTSEASPIVMNGNATTSKEDDGAADSTVGDTHVENKNDDDVIAIESEDSNMEVDNSNVKTPSSSSSSKVIIEKNQTPTSEASDGSMSTLDSNDESKLNLSSSSPSKSITSPPSFKWIRDIAPLSDVQLHKIFIEMKHFQSALKYIQPSSKREGFATVPDITWDDIGALKEVRDELQVSILGPVKYPEAFYAFGISNPAGVLLCGPPGCGKTLLAKAVANEAGINFISVKGPELLNMYVGESERAVRQCFLRAKNSSPCVIFFDELDALCPRRSDGADGNSTSRVVNQLLTEMDGIESRLGVYIMAASNRPDIIDPAVLRPGRLDKILFVNIPTVEDRVDILETITKKGTKPVLDADVNLREIAENDACSCYTGADLAALVREAAVAAFRELVLGPHLSKAPVPAFDQLKVSKRHFDAAFRKIKPSVSKRDLDKYAAMKEKYSVLSAQS